MRSPSPLLLGLVLLMPAPASAGVDASFGWLEADDGGCSAVDGDARDQQCHSRFDYARAAVRDDDGDVARASVWAEDSERRRFAHEHEGDGMHRGDDLERAQWQRGASVETREGNVRADRGCAHEWRWRDNITWTGTWPERTWESDEQTSGSNGCWTRASAERHGETASVEDANPCEGEREGTSEGEETAGGASYTWTRRERSSCANGVGVAAADTGAWAGTRSTCRSTESHDVVREGDETWSDDYRWSRCTTGVVIELPADASLWIGTNRGGDTRCTGPEGAQTCESWRNDWADAKLSWRHNPLGPDDVGTGLGLP